MDWPSKQKSEEKFQKTEKDFLSFNRKLKCIWWKDDDSLMFLPISQIMQIELIPATSNTYNVFARVNLRDRFEYKLIDNRKTLAAAKKLAEDFTRLIQTEEFYSDVTDDTWLKKSYVYGYDIKYPGRTYDVTAHSEHNSIVIAQAKTLPAAREIVKQLIETGELKLSKSEKVIEEKKTEEIPKENTAKFSEKNALEALQELMKDVNPQKEGEQKS